MSPQVQTTTLPNGLRVLTKEIHDAPVATFWVWYRVGARNEVPGITGISHWAEHMLFKGTPTFKKGEIFRSVTKNGGTLNGFTWLDYTTYFETLPSDRIDLALQIEGDRMVNSLFDPDEVESERTVILSERAGNENHPTFHLGEEVNAAAFKVHPYGQGVIGWESDLRAITREDLYNWYRKHYAPNNAVAVAVGDFDTSRLLEAIEDRFGGIPSGPAIGPVRSVEPPQQGERRVVVRRPSPTCYFEAAYHVPSASHPDAVPLIVLDAVLSGAKGMGMSGREGSLGRSSRLYRALVDSGLAAHAGSSFGLTTDPYLFGISAALRPGVALDRVERVVFDEVDRMAQDGVTEEELEKVRKQVRAQIVYGSEGVTSQAYWLGDLEIVSSHELMDTLEARVAAVTSDDVRRVARDYLAERNRTVGWLVPTGDGSSGGSAARPSPAIRACGFLSSDEVTGRQSPLRIEREVLPNGIAVVGHERSTGSSVVVRASLRAGAIFDPADKPGLAVFSARMRQRGAGGRSFREINELTDGIGATFSVDALTQVMQVSFRCLKEDFASMTELLAQVLREPTFPEEEIEKLRGEVLARLREQASDTGAVAERLFSELAYPRDHPYHHWNLGDEATASGIQRADLVDFHHRYSQPNALSVAVVGSLAFGEVVERLRSALGDWPSTGPAVSIEAPDVPRPRGITRRDVAIPGKSQSDIVMGLPSISRKSPDYYRLSFADLVLGGLGLMGRLGEVVRDQQGLAYHVSCSLESLLGPGAWQVQAGVDPKNVEAAIASIFKEIRRMQDEPIEDDELRDGKSYLTGILPLALETSGGVARTLQQIELYDLGLDFLDRYPGIINALTKEEIQGAARSHFSASDLIVVVAGPQA